MAAVLISSKVSFVENKAARAMRSCNNTSCSTAWAGSAPEDIKATALEKDSDMDSFSSVIVDCWWLVAGKDEGMLGSNG
eukprot:scaffold9477_cov197-Amphora_coffeaeformis.AAC.1